jgi:hypothetical protein
MNKRTSEQMRLENRKTRHGMTNAGFLSLFNYQQGRCAICKQKLSPEAGASRKGLSNIDHDPTTNRTRGILCGDCNHGLGKFKHDPALLEAAAEYVRTERPDTFWRELGFPSPPKSRARADARAFSSRSLESLQERRAKGRVPSRGEDRWSAKLKEDDVREILRHPDVPDHEYVKRFGVSASGIRDVKERRTWKHVVLS